MLLVVLVGGCANHATPGVREQAEKTFLPPTAFASNFAAYEEEPVKVTPAVKPYRVAQDLSNITNKDMFQLSGAARKLLIQNGFVVVPSRDHREFFTLYEMNRYQPVPLFVTTDSLLHNYHLFFDHLLRVIETEKLAPELKELNRVMLSRAEKHYAALKGTAWENAAKRNLGFFAVAAKLMNPGSAVPAVVSSEVARELALIGKHAGIEISPVMNVGGSDDPLNAPREDYSQYIPRGHYEKTDLLKAYFKTMMWYGRQTFRFSNEDETKSALLITLALVQDENRQRWEKIYAPTSFFVGQSDDITYRQLQELLGNIYGSSFDLKTIVSDSEKWNTFLEAARELPPPTINSMPIFDETIQPDREKEIKGFRFMGQRFTVDAAIFQRLVYREVKENSRGERRMLPRGLDIPAAMGSAEAYNILKALGETDYQNYPENRLLPPGKRHPLPKKVVWPEVHAQKHLIEIDLVDIDGDGKNELIAIEGDYSDPGVRQVSAWRWNGWGFSLITKEEGGIPAPGNYKFDLGG
ncbi:DUF3160 domain-containing protein [Desulfofundulus thermosubterraneus]|nr:DUF3160 domain-containing protein [Desulfofundulus thermosubterraneus]